VQDTQYFERIRGRIIDYKISSTKREEAHGLVCEISAEVAKIRSFCQSLEGAKEL